LQPNVNNAKNHGQLTVIKDPLMSHSEARYHKARKVSVINAIVNLLLALSKVIIGTLSHSQALIADGLHSLSDLIGDLLVLAAAKAGNRHPDPEHPYGHRRIETLASILIALALLGVALSILTHAIMTISSPVIRIPHAKAVVITALASIVANEWLYRYTLRASQQTQSSLLLSYAWHNRGDVMVSVIVLISVIGVILGWHHLDAVGAVIIAALIGKIAIKMISDSVKELIDTAVDSETLQEITACIQKTPGVIALHQLRTRTHGNQIFIDCHIIVEPKISVSEGHYISDQVQDNLRHTFQHVADITVHIDPEDDQHHSPSNQLANRPELEQQLQPLWQALPGFDSHTMQLHYLSGQLHIELVLPVSILQQHDPKTLQQQYLRATQSGHNIASVTLLWQ